MINTLFLKITNLTLVKRTIFIIIGTILFLNCGFTQDVLISSIANHYLAVDSVLADRVRIVETSELSYFAPGDKILIIQMTGAELNDADDAGWENFKTKNTRVHKTYNNVGKFEILQLDEVVESEGDQYVVFTDDLSNTYDEGEKIQLVRFVEGETVTVTGTVTAQDWDGTTGGIVAVIGLDSIKLNADIDVSNRGFRGGALPSENYTGGCRQNISVDIVDTLYFLPTELNRSGNKGEGIITVDWPYTKGAGFALNGGGAGNGLYSGGAGGSNYSIGGDGGLQSSACTGNLVTAWGGYGCYLLYTPLRRQVIMGGGGGSGVKSSSATASKGGDGGGIVMLITGTISGNGYSISANGESSGSATGSGGGGGAGGTILIDASDYADDFNIIAAGGDGGATNNNCTGSGGGGSGGLLWYSGTSSPSSTIDLSEGQAGYVTSGCILHTGIGGNAGMELDNLLMPLTGFLFNTIRGIDTICGGQLPNLLTGSQPKGGDGSYTYSWEQSTNQIDWSGATGTPTLTSFQSAALDETTYFRRIVNSDGIADTSKMLQIYVYPALTNNIISGTDTLCSGEQASQLSGLQPAGGNEIFEFQWQISPDLSSWSNTGSTENENNPYNPGVLTATSHYRRLVNSTLYCSDTSNNITVVVYDVPVANAGEDSEVCSIEFTLAAIKSISGSDGLWSATDVVFDDPENPSTNVTANTYGSHIFTWTESNWQCTDEDQAEVIFYEQPDVPDAGPDQELQFTYTTTLEALTPAVGTGLWDIITGDGDFNDPATPNTTITNLDNNNLLRWTVTNGVCDPMSDSVEIVVTPLLIDKGFTPNGDTKNDAFVIDAPHAEWIKIKIFDRSGTLVYESDDYTTQEEQWKGNNMNGVELPEGTYYYVAEVKVPGRENAIVFKSFVEILR